MISYCTYAVAVRLRLRMRSALIKTRVVADNSLSTSVLFWSKNITLALLVEVGETPLRMQRLKYRLTIYLSGGSGT